MSADLTIHAPLLPTADAMQLWLHLGWSVVLAWLAVAWVPRRPWTAALAVALWAWAPGAYSPAYWLGLAFQAPSVATVLLCAGGLAAWAAGRSAPCPPPAAQAPPGTEQNALPHRPLADRRVLVLAVLGALTGWSLLLDTFALLPLQIYAWGFSPLVAGVIAAVALLPWAIGRSAGSAQGWRLAVVPLAVLVFVVWRLPSGNAWDAVLDPWLWLALQVPLARLIWNCYRKRS
jgi:hypothetical protein